ncbi:hypothetical protein M5689_004757 [Euphorbia peplus]|nr:hypothetical protein M5689_004757 [Euphorbia peplus]
MPLLIHSPEFSAVKSLFNPNPIPKVIKGLKNGVSFRVRSSRAEFGEFRVSELNRNMNMMLYGQFSAPVKEEMKPSKEEEERRNYYVNMGYAIRTLREEFPDIFYKELSFDIYRDDIVFKDPLNTFVGIENYKSIFWALRFHGRIFFRALWIDIVSVWQPVESVIMVRWTVHGIPRVPWESRGRFDGTSEYKLDKHGKIFHHRVDNIALSSPPRFGVLAVEELIQSIGCSSTPKPTYFEVSSACSKRK